jgi:hypothetical protein
MPRNKNVVSAQQLYHNKEVSTAYNKKGVYPLLVVLDNKGKSLGEYSGYSMNGDIRQHLRLLSKYDKSK